MSAYLGKSLPLEPGADIFDACAVPRRGQRECPFDGALIAHSAQLDGTDVHVFALDYLALEHAC
jgi:hypothetical protein